MEIKGIYQAQQNLIKGVDSIYPKSGQVGQVGSTQPQDKMSFTEFLKNEINQANTEGIEADKRIQSVVTGQEPNPHSALIALQKADISFQLLMSVKERITQAYQEIMRTSIG